MSEEQPSVPAETPAEASPSTSTPVKRDRTIIIRMWPKTPVLYPMALVALICCLVAHFAGSSDLSDYPFGEKPAAAEEATLEPAEAPAPAAEGEAGAHVAPGAEPNVLVGQVEGEAAAAAAAATADELEKKRVDRTLAVIFLVALFFSLFAICVDLDVRWAIIYTSAIVIICLLLWILDITMGFMPKLLGVLDVITPMANAQFYAGVFLVWLVLMGMSFLVTRFHYVKVEPKEVVVYGGMLERQQRYDTMRMRYTKEIHDVMEYYLPFVRFGRLIFSFPEQSEAVIIDNVINIKKVAKRLDEVVGGIDAPGHHHH